MLKNLIDTYIYLAKRDKKGIKIITIFSSQFHIPDRLINISQIPLEVNLIKKIEQIVYDNRLNWELWIESASDYDELKTKLKKRGYIGIPMSPQPEVFPENPVVNVVTNKKIMLQKVN